MGSRWVSASQPENLILCRSTKLTDMFNAFELFVHHAGACLSRVSGGFLELDALPYMSGPVKSRKRENDLLPSLTRCVRV